jgi:dihydrofolate reductase
MPKVRVNAYAISLDGYGAGPDQALANPLGRGGEGLHQWFFPTRTFQRMYGTEEGTTGTDETFAARSMANVGAWIMGRNMFGYQRGPWPDDGWRGWWGEEPPYRCPVFVLTHYARPPIEMKGGTVFHFVTDGIEEALFRAKEAAVERDVRIGGGAATIREYLDAGLIDEMHLVVSPVVLGSGASLLNGIDLLRLGYAVTDHVHSEKAMHVVLSRQAAE